MLIDHQVSQDGEQCITILSKEHPEPSRKGLSYAVLSIAKPEHSRFITFDSVPSEPIPFRALDPQPTVRTAMRLIIQTEEEWKYFWSTYINDETRSIPLPKIDFSKETVIVLARGQCGNSAAGIAVRYITKHGIYYAHRDGSGIKRPSYPSQIVRVPKLNPEIDFEYEDGVWRTLRSYKPIE